MTHTRQSSLFSSVRLLAPSTVEQNPLEPPDEGTDGGTKTVAVQTKYRDSEAQTDPYTPDYTVRPGEEPEILTLASLSYGKGLPAGLAEVEMIERARQKRDFEAALPPITDEASFANPSGPHTHLDFQNS